jgi:5-methylcytosine-specific restriction enzyme subunit McrC
VAIPIQNIYYLLSYAWDKLDTAEALDVNASDYHDSLNLLARVMVNASRHICKKGLNKEYLSVTQEYSGIKGKINFRDSLNRNLFAQGKAICDFDEFTPDVLQNQIIKTTLRNLMKTQLLDLQLESEVRDLFYRFHGIEEIDLRKQHFSQVVIHRNNQHYDFVLNISSLIYENTVLNEDTGDYRFKEFTRDPKAMAALFEKFVYNFYGKEQSFYKVRREDIHWSADPLGSSSRSLLPKMQTDITLESDEHKLIIDTKYYKDTLSENYGSEKFHSGNLYQLHSYLTNVEKDDRNKNNACCDGMLMYPTTQKEIDVAYQIGDHKLRLATVNLDEDWGLIHDRLLELLNFNKFN